MTKEEAISILKRKSTIPDDDYCWDEIEEAFNMAIEALENQKALGEELRKFREGIKDENVLIGFNMAIAICNKYLGEGE